MEKMGYKMKGSGIESPSMDKNKMMYPALHLSHKIPDELKDKDVGDMCYLKVLGKVVSKSEDNMGDSMTIEVHEMGYAGKGKIDKEEYKKMSPEDKDKADEKEVLGDDEDED